VVDANNDLVVANNDPLTPTVALYPPPYTTKNPLIISQSPHPVSLAIDAANNVWILSASNALARHSPPYTPSPSDVVIAGAASTLNTPSALALDPSGRPYVANSGNNTVVRFDPRSRIRRRH
jgi:streptogramin lyase